MFVQLPKLWNVPEFKICILKIRLLSSFSVIMIIIITNQILEKYKTDLKQHLFLTCWGVKVYIFYGGMAESLNTA